MAGLRLIRAFGRQYPEAFFIEIGANDGVKRDHLHDEVLRHGWRGVLVEPVPHVFERLQRNYAGVPGVALENSAISDADGTMTLHHLAPADDGGALPEWYDEIGSFSREHVLRHAGEIPDVEHRLVSITVPVLSYPSLLAKHGVERVDLLLLDTEGHDGTIVRSIDLEAHRPRLIVYEHFHLDASERAAVREGLEAAGYGTLEEGFDTFCLDLRTRDALSRTWQQLRPAVAGVSKFEEPS
jgi:FkbM family methyltransferase